MIGSPSNKALLREAGLLAAEGEQAGANDLVIAVRAADEAAGARSASFSTRCPERRPPHGKPAARSQPGHARWMRCRGANLALISVPGEFAARRGAQGARTPACTRSCSLPACRSRRSARSSCLAREKGLLLMGPGLRHRAHRRHADRVRQRRAARRHRHRLGLGHRAAGSVVPDRAPGRRRVARHRRRRPRPRRARRRARHARGHRRARAAMPPPRSIVLISKPPAPSVAAQVLERLAALPEDERGVLSRAGQAWPCAHVAGRGRDGGERHDRR